MRRKMALGVVALLVSGFAAAGGGFDEFGYNDTARIFVGAADGVDRNLDGMVWGDPTYANDHLKMNWNEEWDRGNDEGWSNPPYDAWTDNNWNGKGKDGSGEVWQYRIIWVGSDLESSDRWHEGGYAIWGQFEVIFSHGTSANEHFWDAHATPAGYGGSE
ncbi:MAG: hypothetical protein L6Q95_06240 [Planctomycetes bacterium]|nr:hypothetical protein [Planctomycetota bacterium]